MEENQSQQNPPPTNQNQNQNQVPPLVTEVPEESQAIPQKSIILFPTVILLIITSILTGSLLYQNIQLKKALKINGFEDCVKENNIIQESYPRVCVTKDGRKFTETINTPVPTPSVEATPLNEPVEEISTTSPSLKPIPMNP